MCHGIIVFKYYNYTVACNMKNWHVIRKTRILCGFGESPSQAKKSSGLLGIAP
jgi:hypothetical protein